MLASTIQKYVRFIYWSAIILNLYKFKMMFDVDSKYYVFPWQGENGQVSRSSHYWLILHLFTALLHVCASANSINPTLSDPLNYLKSFVGQANVDHMRYLLRLCFNGLILINLHNFGEFNYVVSVIVNGGVLFLCHMTSKYKVLYFILLTLPVLLELLSICGSLLKLCHSIVSIIF